MTRHTLHRTVRCTYRNTYHARSLDFGPDYLSELPLNDGATHTLEFPRTVVDVVTLWAVKCPSPSGKEAARGKPSPLLSYPERLPSTVPTTNFQAIGLIKLLYSVSEAALLLSVSRNTVYAFMRSGELLAVYPTSKARIPANALVRFVQIKEDQARLERETLGRRVP